jgi:glycosyltransferase involved in cell wall biosynthesis
MTDCLFRTFFMGGFECSTHRLRSGKRLDLLDATQHLRFARQDFRRLKGQGIQTIRSGIRWHLIEKSPYQYDFSSVLPYLRAVREMDMQVIWDLCHYGYPDNLDLFSPEFPRRFSRMCAAFAKFYASETDQTAFFCPVNEISFFSWGGGDVGYLNPFAHGRGFELKVQLARASIEAMEAILDVLPGVRFVHVDPVINIIPDPQLPEDAEEAENYRLAQYEGWDLIAGYRWPQIGGNPRYLDIIGVNYYHNNQWIHKSTPIYNRSDPLYRPFRQILREVYERYQRPIIISETGIEDDIRPEWLRYVSEEAAAAIEVGVPVEGLCLYPILCHPGWDDERHCYNGLWDYCDDTGEREIYQPLASELRRQQPLIERAQRRREARKRRRELWLSDRARRPHICLFTDSTAPSGMGEHMLLLAGELKRDYQVSFVCSPSPLLERAAKLGVTTVPLALPFQPPVSHRLAWEALRDWLSAHEVDVFHVHAGIAWEGCSAVHAAYHAGVRSIIRSEHLPDLIQHPTHRRNHREAVERVDCLICPSEAVRESFAANGLPGDRLTVVHGSVARHRSRMTRVDVLARLSIPAASRVIFTAARLTEQKGHRFLIEAVPAVLAHIPDAYFVIAGAGELEAELREMVQVFGLGTRVLFLGHRRDVNDLLTAADVFVLPSLFEGMSQAVLEAMAAKVPIVTTAVQGMEEVIEDGVHGRLVPPQNPEALAAAIVDTLTQPELTELRVEVAKRRVEIEFSPARMASEISAIYQSVLQDRLKRLSEVRAG